jgi:hypothetical protein
VTAKGKRRGRLLSGVLTLTAAAGVSLAATGTAEAVPEQCQDKHFCVWEHTGYQGRFYSATGSVSNIGAYMNDRTTSYWNRTDHWITLYNDSNYGGACLVSVPPGGSSYNVTPSVNDAMTSFRTGKFC